MIEQKAQTEVQAIPFKDQDFFFFLTVRVVKQKKRLPRKVVEPSSMEIFKIHLDAYLCELL